MLGKIFLAFDSCHLKITTNSVFLKMYAPGREVNFLALNDMPGNYF